MPIDESRDGGMRHGAGQFLKLIQAASYIGRSPIETLRWAHHCDQRSHVSRFEVPIEDLFPGLFDNTVTLAGLSDMPGEAFDRDLLYISLIAKYLNARRILEIGTLYGRTALNLAHNTGSETRIYTVDSGNDAPGIGKLAGDVGKRFRCSSVAHKITQIIADSQTLDLSPYGQFDLIFIDGDHHYDAVKRDTSKCAAVLEANGVLLWHDYGLAEGVTAFLDECRSKQNLDIKSLRGSLLAVYRSK